MCQELRIIATTTGLYAAVVVTPGPNFALISSLPLQAGGVSPLAQFSE